MKTLFRITLFTVSLLLACIRPLSAGQPHMRGAIDYLEEAKTSGRPIELLRSARAELDTAEHDKGGERVKAIAWIDEAIKAARDGRREKMLERIDHAIASVREGAAIGRR